MGTTFRAAAAAASRSRCRATLTTASCRSLSATMAYRRYTLPALCPVSFIAADPLPLPVEHPRDDRLRLHLERLGALPLAFQQRVELGEAPQREGSALGVLRRAGLQSHPSALKVHVLRPRQRPALAHAPAGQ